MTGKKLDILCVGNALVDIFARDEGFLLSSRHGIKLPVQHLEINKLKELLQTLPEHTLVSGGGTANVAKIAGFLGARVGFTGSIGNDEFGQLFEKSLSEAGVELSLKKSPSPTGFCLYLNDGDGKIRIAASPSASLELSENDIREEDIKKASLVLVDGFMLSRPPLVDHVLNLARLNGITAAIDLSSPDIAREYIYGLLYFARHKLIFFMNEEEAGALYESLKAENIIPEGLNDALSFFQSITHETQFPIFVVKLGSKGAKIVAGGNLFCAEAQAIVSKETTGAGDAFCAAFLAAWLQKKPLAECAAMGNKAARIILDVKGTLVDKEQLKTLFH